MPEFQLIQSLPVGSVSGWVLVAVVLIALIKGWPALRKLKIEEDGSLRADLLARIIRLEESLKDERETCSQQLAEIRKDYEARLAAQGRQIDSLQRELFILRAAAMKASGKGLSDLQTMMKQFDDAQALAEGRTIDDDDK